MNKLRPSIAITLFLFCQIVSTAVAAPPQLKHLLPSGAARGKTVEVTAIGTFPKWPVKVWVDRQGVQVEAAEAKGKLKVTVDPKADVGVYRIRVHDDQGASALRPLLVGSLPEALEKEPNDTLQQPQVIEQPATVNGKLAKAGDVDAYSVELRRGQTLVAAMDANRWLGSPMDGVLQICNTDGFVLAQNDDGRGIDPLVVFQVPRDGTYLIRTFAFPLTPNSSIRFAGGDDFVYRLTVTTGAFVDHAFPLALADGSSTKPKLKLHGWNIPPDLQEMAQPTVADHSAVMLGGPQFASTLRLPIQKLPLVVADEQAAAQQPQEITLPVVISGRLEADRDEDTFGFSATKGQKLVFRAEANSLGYPTDPLLRIHDANGKMLKEIDDVSKQRDCKLDFTVPADGAYRLSIQNRFRSGGFRHVYRLTVQVAQPDFQLTLAAGEFIATVGKPLEIPITINRQHGYNQEIEISAVGLPEGVTATTVKSAAKGDTAKSVKLVVNATAPHEGAPFRIEGKAAENASHEATFTSVGESHHEPWLTVRAP